MVDAAVGGFINITIGFSYIIGVTVLLSLTVFQDSISEKMPITSLQIPLLGITPTQTILILIEAPFLRTLGHS